MLACWTVGNGTMPVLPLYAIEQGASQSTSGLFLASAFLCLALGTMAPGVLPKSFRHRRMLLVASGVPIVFLTWLCGRVVGVLQLAVVTGVLWFLAGIVFSQCATLVGLTAEPADRGTAFGILGMTNGLGALIGGLSVGYIADRAGFQGVFSSLAAFCILIVIGGLLSVEHPPSWVSEASSEAGASGSRGLGGVLVLLLLAQLILAVANGTANLGRSLSMDAGGFSRSAITFTAAIQGLVSLGFPLVMGRLSDRVGRRWVLIGCFAATGASLFLLAFSRSLWHFCGFAVLYSFVGASQAIGPAYVVDIDPRGNVGRGVSLFQSTYWVGSIVGMASSGYAMQRLGMVTPILISGLFPAAAAVLLLASGGPARSEAPAAPSL
ncbi:MAG: MFS transporter [Spirochaetales bacterium]|nr:MFS transporter [Spirochaetales bacterium]